MERKNYRQGECSAVMGTLTAAQKAQKALGAAAIPANISKTESSSSHRGCVWSISFSCNQKQNVMTVLSNAGIPVKSWEGSNDIF